MYLTLFNAVHGLFTSASQKPNGRKPQDHFYIRGDITDRGPCPGLNALANQGYLPRDGRDISPSQVEEALMTALHMDKALASSLARSLRPLVRKDGTFDLSDMRRHNVIEHDASFTRLDFRQGDNFTFQPTMFQAMLDDADGGPVTIKSLAKTYVRRNKESRAAGAPRLPLNLWFVNMLQTVSLMNTAQTGGKLSPELLTTFYVEERYPDEILDNDKPRTLVGLVWHAVALFTTVMFTKV